MHFTDTVYRNPYWPTWPLLQITQGCTHNSCKFCTMYRNVDFCMQPMEWIEEDLRELAQTDPKARTIQLLSANPLALSYDKLVPILEMIRRYLPNIEVMYTQGRVSDLKNKTVEQLKHLKELGMREISLGVESGDDWTLDRINKGYHAEDILEQHAVLIGIGSVETVVAGHEAARSAFFNGNFKIRQVQLAQRSFIHDGVGMHSEHFLAVGRKMLGACRNAVGLDAADISRSQFACKVWIFGIVFKAAAAQT